MTLKTNVNRAEGINNEMLWYSNMAQNTANGKIMTGWQNVNFKWKFPQGLKFLSFRFELSNFDDFFFVFFVLKRANSLFKHRICETNTFCSILDLATLPPILWI